MKLFERTFGQYRQDSVETGCLTGFPVRESGQHISSAVVELERTLRG
jgi:hypothetical protein